MVGSVCFLKYGCSLRTKSFFLQSPQGTPGFEKRKVEWLLLVLRDGVLHGFDAGAEFPDEGGEFASD